MKTVPNAKPPTTKCHQGGIWNIALFELPAKALNTKAMATPPITVPVIIRHEPMPVAIKIAAPIRHASVLVSPIEP